MTTPADPDRTPEAAPHPRASAPPTRPGVVDTEAGEPPASARHAIGWSIGGVLFFPLGIVGIVCGIVALRRIRRSERAAGTGLAIAGIAVGVLDLALLLPIALALTWTMASFNVVRAAASSSQSRMNATSMIVWAKAHARATGTYPDHIAELALIDRTAMDRLMKQYPTVDERAEALVGGLDLPGLLADGEDDADHDRLREALDDLDTSAPSYEFAGHVYMRLGEPTDDSRLIFSYYDNPAMGLFLVVTDDGAVQFITRRDWDRIWDDDAEARRELGLPEFRPD